MCLLLETIKIENGEIRNLEYHNRRFNSSRRESFGSAGEMDAGADNDIDLGSVITIPSELGSGVFRCRVLYRREIVKIEFLPHEDRMVKSLKLVHSDDIEYSLKYADREFLKSLFELRENCDEILIVKNGFITDTSISNIVFRLPDGSWITPDTPLLNGTMRMNLLEAGRITEAPIRPGDLGGFTGARMINCMMGLDTGPVIEMNRIFD
jgi:4-amino-4-deoxychorismate lyase